jgi:hypothetical protein
VLETFDFVVASIHGRFKLEHDAFRFTHSLNFENSWRIRRV